MGSNLKKMVEDWYRQHKNCLNLYQIMKIMAAEIDAYKTSQSLLWGEVKANREEIEKLKAEGSNPNKKELSPRRY